MKNHATLLKNIVLVALLMMTIMVIAFQSLLVPANLELLLITVGLFSINFNPPEKRHFAIDLLPALLFFCLSLIFIDFSKITNLASYTVIGLAILVCLIQVYLFFYHKKQVLVKH